jgi:hypothetical protein
MLLMMEGTAMSFVSVVTFAVALSLPVWLALEEIIHRSRRLSAEAPVPASRSREKRPAKLAHPHPA